MNRLMINTSLTTLNEYIAAANSNKFAAAKVKKQNEDKIILLAKAQKFSLKKETAYYVIINWYNYRQDPDNVEFAQKFIFDALQKGGFLKNDNSKYILQPKVHFHLKGKKYPKKVCEVLFFDDYLAFINGFNKRI